MARVLALVAAVAAFAPAPLLAQQGAPYTVAETGRGYARLQQAVDAIGNGSGTVLVGDGVHADCAVQERGQVSFRAANPGKAVFQGRACEDKAVLVLRGRGASVDGLIFRGIAVPDRNGAGIRLERGDLIVRNAMFRDSEEGILTADDPGGRISIDRSTFSGLGRCDGGASCAHSIYIGKYGALSVTRSRFERGNGGHYVKSRALRILVADSSFDDTRGRATNYMIDLSNGAVGAIRGNVFVQGPNKENHSCLIAIAAEGKEQSSAGLSIVNNEARIAPGVTWPTVFVADWSGDRIALGANRLGPRIKPFERR